MRALLIFVLALHGAIHLLGFAKGSGLAEIPEFRNAIGRREAFAWLTAAILLGAAAAALWSGARWWWLPALGGIVLSQILIFTVWSDARFGTLVNLALLLPVVLAAFDARPSSLRSSYERAAEHAPMRVDRKAAIVTHRR